MPGAPCLATSAPLTGESELKKLVLGVHCTVSALSGEQRELGRRGPYVRQPGPGHQPAPGHWSVLTRAGAWSVVTGTESISSVGDLNERLLHVSENYVK